MPISKNAKTVQLTEDQNLLAGMQKNQTTMPPLSAAGAALNIPASIAVVESRVNAGIAFVTARGGFLQAAQANRDLLTQTKEEIDNLTAAIKLAFKNDPAKLADFGFVPPKKRAPRTTATNVVAVAKGASTRVERHTMGPKQKEKVKGSAPATITIDVPGASPPPAATVTATATPVVTPSK